MQQPGGIRFNERYFGFRLWTQVMQHPSLVLSLLFIRPIVVDCLVCFTARLPYLNLDTAT